MIFIQPSKVHGQGVFTDKSIKEGEVIERCPFLTIASDHVNDECILHDYVFGSYDDDKIFVVLGYGMIYNHSKEPNAEWFVSDCGSFIQFEAVKNINAQEEIFHDYGMEYWNSRNI